MLIQAFLAPLVLHVAGQETLGVYALLTQAIGYLAMVDLGFSVALNIYLARAKGHEDGDRRSCQVLSTARTFMLGSNTVFAILTLLLSFKVEALFSLTPQVAGQARLCLCLLAVWGVAKTPWALYWIGLNATQDLVAAHSIGTFGSVTRLTVSLVLVYSGMGLVGLMLGSILSEVLQAALSTLRFRRLYPEHRLLWGIPDKALFREMLIFGAQSAIVSIAWRLVYYTDNIVIGYLFGAVAASIYYITQMPATIGFNIVNRLADNASPAVNELYARKEETRLREIFLRLHRYNILLVLPLVAGLLLLNRRLITLWVGPEQYAGDLMTAALAAFSFLITVSHVSGAFMMASGNMRILTRVAILEGIANLGLSLWLGKIIGLPGVMLATVIANLPATSYLLLFMTRNLRIGIPEYLRVCILPSLFPITIGCAMALLCGRLIPDKGWVSFIAQGTILVTVYAGIAFKAGLNHSERAWIGGQMSQIKSLAAKRNIARTG